MDKVVDEWEWILILPGDGIQSSVVPDEAELSILLKTGAPRGDLDCLIRPVASASSHFRLFCQGHWIDLAESR
jgi:hypothetical protein